MATETTITFANFGPTLITRPLLPSSYPPGFFYQLTFPTCRTNDLSSYLTKKKSLSLSIYCPKPWQNYLQLCQIYPPVNCSCCWQLLLQGFWSQSSHQPLSLFLICFKVRALMAQRLVSLSISNPFLSGWGHFLALCMIIAAIHPPTPFLGQYY